MELLSYAKRTLPYLSSGVELFEAVPSPSPREIIPLDKKVESISTAAYLALLGMNAYGKGAKLEVADNAIHINKAEITQGYKRWTNNSSIMDIETYKILTIAIDYPQSWYKLDSEEAKYIVRIHNITKLGLEYLKETYKDKEYFLYYIESFIQKCNDYETNVKDAGEQSIEPEIKFISNFMKECWSQKKYKRLVLLLETAYGEFTSKRKPSEKSITAITKFLTKEVEKFTEKLNADYNNRFDF